MKKFDYVSLFSGIGGFDLAFNNLGGSCAMASEIDQYARKSYKLMYNHEAEGDITKITNMEVPEHDLLSAGFPCPTFSVAGKRDGMEYSCTVCGHNHLITYEDYKSGPKCPECTGETKAKDERGLLFFEIARIADFKQPKALLLENVKGLVNNSKGEVIRVIAETLDYIGYTIDFQILNSKFFNVPQHRERVFIVAIRNDLVEHEEWVTSGKKNVLDIRKAVINELGVKTFNFDWPKQESTTKRLRDILETNVEERYYLSEDKTKNLIAQLEQKRAEEGEKLNRSNEARVIKRELAFPVKVRKHEVDIKGIQTLLRSAKAEMKISNRGIAEKLDRPITEVEHWFRTDKCFAIPDPELWPALKELLEIADNRYDAQITEFIERPGLYEKANRFYEVEGLSPTLTVASADEKIIEPQESFILDTKPKDAFRIYTDFCPTLQANDYKEPKQVVEPQMIGRIDIKGHDAVKRVYSPDGVAPTLTTMGGGHREPKIVEEINLELVGSLGLEGYAEMSNRVYSQNGLAKTLMGGGGNAGDKTGLYLEEIPRYRIRKLTPRECFRLQGFPDSEFDKLKGLSNSQLYKQAGNAVTVTVVQAIGERLLKYL